MRSKKSSSSFEAQQAHICSLVPSFCWSTVFPCCGNGEERAEHSLCFCLQWAAECRQYFADSVVDIPGENLMEFLISLGHLLSRCTRHCLMAGLLRVF